MARPKSILLDRHGHMTVVASDRNTLNQQIHVWPVAEGHSHLHHKLDAPADLEFSLRLEENSFSADVKGTA